MRRAMDQSGTGTRKDPPAKTLGDRREGAAETGTTKHALPETEKVMAVLEELGLEPAGAETIGAAGSILVPALGGGGRRFLLKYYLSCPSACYEPGTDPAERALQRESSFYRYLDVVDRDRCFANIPRMVIADQQEKPRWTLFEGIRGAAPAATRELRPDWLVDTLRSLQDFPARLTDGRRGLSLERWDSYAHREVILQMRDRVEPRVGEKAWDLLCRTLNEAREWTESTEPILVNGWFQDDTLLVDERGRIYQHEFRRVGLGGRHIDFAWYWLSRSGRTSSTRSTVPAWRPPPGFGSTGRPGAWPSTWPAWKSPAAGRKRRSMPPWSCSNGASWAAPSSFPDPRPAGPGGGRNFSCPLHAREPSAEFSAPHRAGTDGGISSQTICPHGFV